MLCRCPCSEEEVACVHQAPVLYYVACLSHVLEPNVHLLQLQLLLTITEAAQNFADHLHALPSAVLPPSPCSQQPPKSSLFIPCSPLFYHLNCCPALMVLLLIYNSAAPAALTKQFLISGLQPSRPLPHASLYNAFGCCPGAPPLVPAALP